MELSDCAFPTLQKIVATDDAKWRFATVTRRCSSGARAARAWSGKTAARERADFLGAGQGIECGRRPQREGAAVGNPANTNAWIARANAKDLNPRNFTAMTRLDHNRAVAARGVDRHARHRDPAHDHLGQPLATVSRRLARTRRRQEPVAGNQAWLEGTFIPVAARCGDHQGARRSSAASAASAAIVHVRDWFRGSATGDWLSMAVPSDGSYGIPEGVIYSYPVTTKGGEYQIVPGLSIDEFSRKRMDATLAELREERDGVKELLG